MTRKEERACDREGRMGLADAYMVFVGMPVGLATIAYGIYMMTRDLAGWPTSTELWGAGGAAVVMLVGFVLMNRDPGMRRNMEAARLRAARRAARADVVTIEVTVRRS